MEIDLSFLLCSPWNGESSKFICLTMKQFFPTHDSGGMPPAHLKNNRWCEGPSHELLYRLWHPSESLVSVRSLRCEIKILCPPLSIRCWQVWICVPRKNNGKYSCDLDLKGGRTIQQCCDHISEPLGEHNSNGREAWENREIVDELRYHPS